MLCSVETILFPFSYFMNCLTRNHYHEYCDLPALRPIFSCAPCNKWRQRVPSAHFKDWCKLDRTKLPSCYQCQCKKTGYGRIHIRAVCSHAVAASSSESEAELVDDAVIIGRPKASIAIDEKVVLVDQAKALVPKTLQAKQLGKN